MKRRPELRLGEPPSEKEIEQAMLERVLSITGGDEGKIFNAINIVVRGEHDRARRIYLSNLLERKARARIRRASRKEASSHIQPNEEH